MEHDIFMMLNMCSVSPFSPNTGVMEFDTVLKGGCGESVLEHVQGGFIVYSISCLACKGDKCGDVVIKPIVTVLVTDVGTIGRCVM
jgi:hypothetical protein